MYYCINCTQKTTKKIMEWNESCFCLCTMYIIHITVLLRFIPQSLKNLRDLFTFNISNETLSKKFGKLRFRITIYK